MAVKYVVCLNKENARKKAKIETFVLVKLENYFFEMLFETSVEPLHGLKILQ